MKIGWLEVPLEEVAELRPVKKQVKSKLAENDVVSFVPMAQLSETDRKFVEAEKRELSSVYKAYTYFEDGDVLVAKITPCYENGKMGLARELTNGVGFGSSEFFVLRPNENLDAEYLTYFLDQDSIREAGQAVMGGAVGHQRVPNNFFQELLIPVPPLDEQRQIVGVLDEALSALNSARKNLKINVQSSEILIANAAKKLALRLQDECQVMTLSELCEFRNGLNFSNSSAGQIVKVVGVGDFKNRKIIPVDCLSEKKIDGELVDQDLIQDGDILTVRSNGNRLLIGRMMLAEGVEERISFSGFTIRIRPLDEALNSRFLFAYLKSGFVRDELTSGGGGANINNLNQKMLGAIKIYVPKAEEQACFVNMIRSLDEKEAQLVAKYESQLADIEDLRQSLLQRAFAGELTEAAPILATNDNQRDERFSTASLVLAFDKHLVEQRQNTFGHVKAQKILHLTESIAGLDLGRQPQVRQAGPHDQEHFARVEAWAKKKGVFEFKLRRSGGYTFSRGTNYDAFLSEAKTLLAENVAGLSRFLPLMVDMNTEEAEVFTTVHAAWNNLLADGKTPSDDEIVTAARENWHESKMEIARQKFFNAVTKIRRHDLEPDGFAKYVSGVQESLI